MGWNSRYRYQPVLDTPATVVRAETFAWEYRKEHFTKLKSSIGREINEKIYRRRAGLWNVGSWRSSFRHFFRTSGKVNATFQTQKQNLETSARPISFRDISDIFWRNDRVKKEIHLRFRVLGVTFNCNLRALRVKFLVSRAMFSGVCVAWSTFDLSFVPAVLPVGLLAPFTAKFNCGWDLLDLAPLHLLYLQRGRKPAFNLVKLQNHHCFAKTSYRPWWIATNRNRIVTKAALVKNERNTATILYVTPIKDARRIFHLEFFYWNIQKEDS